MPETTQVDTLAAKVSSGLFTYLSRNADPFTKSIMSSTKADCIATEMLADADVRAAFGGQPSLSDSDVQSLLNDPAIESNRDRSTFRCMTTSELVESITANADCCQERYTDIFKSCLTEQFEGLDKNDVVDDLIRRYMSQPISTESGFRKAWATCGFSLPD